MKHPKLLALALAVCLLCALVPAGAAEDAGAHALVLSDEAITLDGAVISEGGEGDVTLSHDIIYYEDRDAYDSGNPYGEGAQADRHSAQEAAAHTVVTITQPGTYRVSGTLSQGQLAIDLGKGAKTDPQAVVTLILDGLDLTCTVAPAVIFYNVYECDTAWVAYDEGETEDYQASRDQDLSAAGARVVLADGSVNNVAGAYVARIYKDNGQKKKLHKYDGAFYSKMSMTVAGEAEGSGTLHITAANEGLDSELHLGILGGNLNIASQDDGINTNEDGVSSTTISGGSLHIVAGLGGEGDGIDSNGFLTIRGGTVISIANPRSDSGLDSDMGSVIDGGYVVATGSTMDWPETDSDQVTVNLQFAASQSADEAIIVTDREGKVVFAYDPDQDETTGIHNRGYQGAVISCPEFQVGETYQVYVGGGLTGTEVNGLYDAATVTAFTGAVRQQFTGTDVRGFRGGHGGMGGMRPEGFEPPEGFEFPEGMERPDGFRGPEGMERPQRGERPQDMAPGQGETPPEPPSGGAQPGDDMTPPELPEGEAGGRRDGFSGGFGGFDFGQMAASEGQPSLEFYMQDKVNFFSGLTDETVAYPSATTVEVDGRAVEFQMYALKDANGNETNYVKVRDVALALNGTAAQFNVTWDGAVSVTSATAYEPNGSELQTPFAGDQFYQPAAAQTQVNGQTVDLHAILLTDADGGGYTYYQLRDLGRALDFNVSWDETRAVVTVETGKPYTG